MTDALTQVAREVEDRRYGKYRGTVVDNADPDELGRLTLKVPSTLGDQTTDWAPPCLPFGGSAGAGLLLLPEVGADVWVEFEQGDISHPIWVGTYWKNAPQKGGPDLAKPTARTLRSPGGQILRMDDEDGKTGITLHHKSGAEITIEDDGKLTVTDGKGQIVTLDASNKKVLVEDANGNKMQLSSSGLTLDNGQGAKVELSGPSVTIKGTSVTLDAQSVSLGTGSEPVIKGTSFLSAYMAHMHATAAPGPPSPPIPTTESTAMSSSVKTG
ncbi:MAG: hypothetical protein QOH61_569 [Chloroflexota bacterium]|jgi:uncharacterized protein involved in type VI secretion and phage assembly|nr:hypothetical protein [Chloroflexota bacterium]